MSIAKTVSYHEHGKHNKGATPRSVEILVNNLGSEAQRRAERTWSYCADYARGGAQTPSSLPLQEQQGPEGEKNIRDRLRNGKAEEYKEVTPEALKRALDHSSSLDWSELSAETQEFIQKRLPKQPKAAESE
ncbi:MAG: hypothetical protein SNF33_05765 [Candidatus Algichlamydia australiensis]|nr:hypothetical protein [Chlamydiales bacterium]